ncbi:MAG: recombination mediator RecR [Myxococcota bacterium]
MSTNDPIREAVRALRRLPGIGEKTATRLVYWLLRAPDGTVPGIAHALQTLVAEVRQCQQCGDLSGTDPCAICADGRRDSSIVVVVEHPQDVLAFERSGEYRGRYHILHGAISPLDGVGPADLNIRPLLERLREGSIEEVVLATDPDIEGDATALYLGRLLSNLGVKVTRLAHGISVGTEIEFADAASLAQALQHRREL